MDSPDTESVEAMQARHRRELRDLQGRITNKKKNATKKTRKGVLDECAALERALRERQEGELRAVEGGEEEGTEEAEEAEEAEKAESARIGGPEEERRESGATAAAPPVSAASPAAAAAAGPKRNRQRERLARRAAEAQQRAAAAADEAATMVDYAARERDALAPLLAASGRVEHVVRADGHCLFSAVADQLEAVGVAVEARGSGAAGSAADAGAGSTAPPHLRLRHAAAAYMEAHPDDFAPFLDTPLAAHVRQIRDTAAWGGQLELTALAHVYGVDIRVLHDGRSELIQPTAAATAPPRDSQAAAGPDGPRPTLWLVYYRHGFGLGEHYNSLRAKA